MTKATINLYNEQRFDTLLAEAWKALRAGDSRAGMLERVEALEAALALLAPTLATTRRLERFLELCNECQRIYDEGSGVRPVPGKGANNG